MAWYRKFFTFDLTPQQAQAFEQLMDFVQQDALRIFILKGYAGTGKTSLMRGLIGFLKSKDIRFELLASTGRAAKMLAEKSGAAARTVHSRIYQFKGFSEDVEKMLQKQGNAEILLESGGQLSLTFGLKTLASEKMTLYIVDEASMIADEAPGARNSFAQYGEGSLLSDLLSFDPKGQFIFVGDPCQLPPIQSVESPALSVAHFRRRHGLAAAEVELKAVMRQAGDNGILKTAGHLRTYVERDPGGKWAFLPARGLDNVQIHPNHAQLVQEYVAKIDAHDLAYATMICNSNRQRYALNHEIRQLLGRGEELLAPGELLQVTQNNYLSGLSNGDLLRVLEAGTPFKREGISYVKVRLEPLHRKGEIETLMVADILPTELTNISQAQHQGLLISFSKRMRSSRISPKSADFMTNLQRDPYLNALKAVYGYAITCHKSQGGEWNEVFLWQDNKIQGMKRPGLYQWWYTAITRAVHTLHLTDSWFLK